MGRTTLSSRMDDRYESLRSVIAMEIAKVLLTVGQGAFFLQLDGVTTKRGDCEPVLMSWIDPLTCRRRTVVLGLGYDTGKGAAEAAICVRHRLEDLELLSALQKIVNEGNTKSFPALKHYQTKMTEFKEAFEQQEVSDDDASFSALASYMFGSATTDGAILRLLEEIAGTRDAGPQVDKTTTHHCSAHRLSLIGRFAFGEKSQQSIWCDKQALAVLQQFKTVIDDLQNHFAVERNFRQLQDYSKTLEGNKQPRRMNKPTPTRFNSYIQLLMAIRHNMPIFAQLHGNAGCPAEVEALYEVMQVVLEEGADPILLKPHKELPLLCVVGSAITRLTCLAETDEQDAFWFHSELSLYCRQLAQQNEPFEVQTDDGTLEISAAAFGASAILPGICGTINSAISFYFDEKLASDWAELLCLILHPCCSGFPAEKGVASPWPCLVGRFKFCRVDSRRVTEAEARQKIVEVMKAGEKILREELELQYNIDTSAGNTQAAGAAASGTEEVTPSPAPKKSRVMKLLPTLAVQGGNAGASPSRAVTATEKKRSAVEKQMAYWLSRPAMHVESDEELPTMLSFWQNEGNSMLRRVALRVGAFMVSQCATERVNKIPKSIWDEGRLRLLPDNMRRDVFLHCNMDWLPPHSQ